MWKTLKQIACTGIISEPVPCVDEAEPEISGIQQELRYILGHALAIRQVDTGSCNGCELEINALNNPYYNIESIGIKFVASPRHADLLLVTGPVTRHMDAALRRTYEATPAPKLVVAVGDCACTGGIFCENYATCGAVSKIVPVDFSVPGCPPAPLELLRGILMAVRRCGAQSHHP